MLDLSSISLLCLDTRNPELAVKVMQRCMTGTRFHEAVLLTHADFRCDDPRITVHAVRPLRSVADYSAFMLKELSPYFTGSHVLVMQWDGFILDPAAWDPAFLEYDYIGAPWPGTWPHIQHQVGNGGFSLRSRKLVDALHDPEIVRLHPEDDSIGNLYHDLLVGRYGIAFAPLELASRFAFENIPPSGPTFGFHGLGHIGQALTDQEALAFLQLVGDGILLSGMGRQAAKGLIRAGHYQSAKKILATRARLGNPKQRLDALKLYCRLGLQRAFGRESRP